MSDAVTNAVPWDRVPLVLTFIEPTRMTETYGFSGNQGATVLEAQRLFEIRTKLVSTAKDVDQSGTSLMKLPA